MLRFSVLHNAYSNYHHTADFHKIIIPPERARVASLYFCPRFIGRGISIPSHRYLCLSNRDSNYINIRPSIFAYSLLQTKRPIGGPLRKQIENVRYTRKRETSLTQV